MNPWDIYITMAGTCNSTPPVLDRKPSPHSAFTVLSAHKANREKGMRNTLAILEVVRRNEGKTLTQLARLCGVSGSSAHHHLHRLATLNLAHRRKSVGGKRVWGWFVGAGGV